MSEGRCRETRELLAAFLDDELPLDRSHAVRDHLDDCDGCRGFSSMEQDFTRQVRARLGPCEPPAALREGLRTAMDAVDSLRSVEAVEAVEAVAAEPATRPRAATRAMASPWMRRLVYGMAAAGFFVALLVPVVRQYEPGLYDQARMFLTGTQRQAATLVCVECEQEGTPLEAQRHCRAPGHQTGLRCPHTGLWHLVANEATLPLMRDRERRGDTVIVEGRWLDDIHYVDARSVRLPPGI
jgi:hypothetical protein